MSTSRFDDLFDPERLGALWSGGPSVTKPELPAAEIESSPAEAAAALLAQLTRALERDFGRGAARCKPFLARASHLCAALPDPAAQEQLISLLDGLEDLLEVAGVGPSPGELPRG